MLYAAIAVPSLIDFPGSLTRLSWGLAGMSMTTTPSDDRPPKQTTFNVKDEFQALETAEVKSIAQAQALGYSVALANVTGDLNIGFIVRTAACLCAERVFIFGRRKWDRRSAVGSNVYIPVDAYQTDTDPFDWDSMFQTIRINGYLPIVIEQGGAPLETLADSLIPGVKPCLIFGAEGSGIPQEHCEPEIWLSIDQPGVIRSLNVSSAAAIAMYHTMVVVR